MTDHPTEVLHLETDGRLFLVDTAGEGPALPEPGRLAGPGGEAVLLRHPTASEARAAGLTWEVIRTNRFLLGSTRYVITHAHPRLDRWPTEWAWKDDCVSDSACHPAVREAVWRSVPRLVAKTVIEDPDGNILMVQASRGFFAGMWTLSGGYVDYAEHPRTGAVRELEEELGLVIELADPWREVTPGAAQVPPGGAMDPGWSFVSERIFSAEGIQFVSFTYRTTVEQRPDLDLRPDEIARAEWFSLEDALERAASLFDVQALQRLAAAREAKRT